MRLKIASIFFFLTTVELESISFRGIAEKIPQFRIIVSSRDFLLHITQNLISHLVLDIYVTHEKHEAIKLYIYIYILEKSKQATINATIEPFRIYTYIYSSRSNKLHHNFIYLSI